MGELWGGALCPQLQGALTWEEGCGVSSLPSACPQPGGEQLALFSSEYSQPPPKCQLLLA